MSGTKREEGVENTDKPIWRLSAGSSECQQNSSYHIPSISNFMWGKKRKCGLEVSSLLSATHLRWHVLYFGVTFVCLLWCPQCGFDLEMVRQMVAYVCCNPCAADRLGSAAHWTNQSRTQTSFRSRLQIPAESSDQTLPSVRIWSTQHTSQKVYLTANTPLPEVIYYLTIFISAALTLIEVSQLWSVFIEQLNSYLNQDTRIRKKQNKTILLPGELINLIVPHLSWV